MDPLRLDGQDSFPFSLYVMPSVTVGVSVAVEPLHAFHMQVDACALSFEITTVELCAYGGVTVGRSESNESNWGPTQRRASKQPTFLS